MAGKSMRGRVETKCNVVKDHSSQASWRGLSPVSEGQRGGGGGEGAQQGHPTTRRQRGGHILRLGLGHLHVI